MDESKKPGSGRKKMATLSVIEGQVKSRSCLKCGETFESVSFGNRLCWRCNGDNNAAYTKSEHKHPGDC